MYSICCSIWNVLSIISLDLLWKKKCQQNFLREYCICTISFWLLSVAMFLGYASLEDLVVLDLLKQLHLESRLWILLPSCTGLMNLNNFSIGVYLWNKNHYIFLVKSYYRPEPNHVPNMENVAYIIIYVCRIINDWLQHTKGSTTYTCDRN